MARPHTSGRRGESFPCPACGEPVPAGRPSCAACGADERTGWAKDDAEETSQELDLPRDMDDEEYADFVADEFGGERRPSSRGGGGRALVLIGLAVLVLGLLLWLLQSSSSPR